MLDEVISATLFGDKPDLISLAYDFIENKPKDIRAEGWHPSEFGSDWFCIRKKIIDHEYKQAGISKKERIDPNTQYIFDIGHSLHRQWQDDYFGEMGILEGWWNNPATEDRVFGFKPKDGGKWFYEEIEVRIPELDIVGHIDGILVIKGKRYLLDIKTMKPEKWDQLTDKAPNGYINQLTTYLKAKGMTEGVLFFVNKSTGRPKQIFVDFNDAHYENLIDSTIHKFYELVKAEKLPPKTKKCPSNGWMRTRCPVRYACEGCRNVKKLREFIKEEI